jgi:hypothetical protein
MATHIYQIILQAQAEIPPQVLRQQPVYLEDAYGVEVVFSLEFITCPEVSMDGSLPRRQAY